MDISIVLTYQLHIYAKPSHVFVLYYKIASFGIIPNELIYFQINTSGSLNNSNHNKIASYVNTGHKITTHGNTINA